MPTLVRTSLLGILAIVAIAAAVFVVKLALAVASIVLTVVVAVVLFRFGRTLLRRHDRGAGNVTTYRG